MTDMICHSLSFTLIMPENFFFFGGGGCCRHKSHNLGKSNIKAYPNGGGPITISPLSSSIYWWKWQLLLPQSTIMLQIFLSMKRNVATESLELHNNWSCWNAKEDLYAIDFKCCWVREAKVYDRSLRIEEGQGAQFDGYYMIGSGCISGQLCESTLL